MSKISFSQFILLLILAMLLFGDISKIFEIIKDFNKKIKVSNFFNKQKPKQK